MNLLTLLNRPPKLFQPIVLFQRVELHLSTLLLFVFAIGLRFAHLLLLTYLIVLVHEMAHVCTALALKVQVEKLEFLPFGVTMQLRHQTIRHPSDEIKIAIAGPLSNVLLGGFALALFRMGWLGFAPARFLVLGNCAIAAINLIPALPLDGGRILRAYLTIHWGYLKAFNTTMLWTKVLSVALLLCGGLLLWLTKFNFSLLLISCFLLFNASLEQRGCKLTMMREILYNREKLAKEKLGQASTLVMMHDANVRAALKMLSYNKYYFIRIVDQNMEPIVTVSETQLIRALIEKGMAIKGWQIADATPNAPIPR